MSEENIYDFNSKHIDKNYCQTKTVFSDVILKDLMDLFLCDQYCSCITHNPLISSLMHAIQYIPIVIIILLFNKCKKLER